MSYLMNIKPGVAEVLASGKPKHVFEVHINRWEAPEGDKNVPETFGTFMATPAFLRDFVRLCEKHRCGDEF